MCFLDGHGLDPDFSLSLDIFESSNLGSSNNECLSHFLNLANRSVIFG